MQGKRLLELALAGLEVERRQVDTEILDLQGRLSGVPEAAVSLEPRSGRKDGGRRRGKMSPARHRAFRKKMSVIMTERWAKRRRAKR